MLLEHKRTPRNDIIHNLYLTVLIQKSDIKNISTKNSLYDYAHVKHTRISLHTHTHTHTRARARARTHTHTHYCLSCIKLPSRCSCSVVASIKFDQNVPQSIFMDFLKKIMSPPMSAISVSKHISININYWNCKCLRI